MTPRQHHEAARLAEQDARTAEKLRAILHTAITAIEGLTFNHHFPVRGYDQADVIEQLRDMCPPVAGAVYARAVEAAEFAMEGAI